MKKTNVLVLYCHPYNKSFSKAMADRALIEIKKVGKNAKMIDLYKDNFNPLKPTKTAIKKYQESLLNADEIVIFSPVWWSGVPAIMEGFIEHVFAKDVCYKLTASGRFENLMTRLKKANVYTTSITPNFFTRFGLRNPKRNRIVYGLLKEFGVTKITYRNLDNVSCSQERRERFLNKLANDLGGKHV